MKRVCFLLLVGLLFAGCSPSREVSTLNSEQVITIEFPSDRYPETAAHIREAIAHGESDTCTIDRTHIGDHRKESLKGIPTKKGKDRDEWPMALCREGGKGADVKYVRPADNRGAGAWIRNKLKKYRDGTRVRFVIPKKHKILKTST